jgi:hypothetical protein
MFKQAPPSGIRVTTVVSSVHAHASRLPSQSESRFANDCETASGLPIAQRTCRTFTSRITLIGTQNLIRCFSTPRRCRYAVRLFCLC